MLEVSQPLSMRLMAPNDVVGAAKIPSAHPTAGLLLAADVPCRLAMSFPDDGQTLFWVQIPSVPQPDSSARSKQASKMIKGLEMMLANRPPALDPRLGTRAEAPREQA